jgi:dTMP kinase
VNKLISFEGVDGCGKSTQLKRAADWLSAQGQDVVTTFEPGDTTLGAEIRRLLLAGEFVPVPEAELLLFLADRAQHVQQLIRPALERGAWVLCDRYSDSTLAYQLAARKLGQGAANLKEMLAFAECGVSPALTLWFDVPVSEALKRMQKRVEAG